MNDEKENLSIEPFERGFNIKAILAAVFIGFLILPGAIYLALLTGGGIGGAAQWVTIILFIEIAKRSFVQLKRQEIYIIYIMAGSLIGAGVVMGASGLVLPGGIFGAKIWDAYFIRSTYADKFGLREIIPRWVVPPADSEALLGRSFFHKQWLIPIVILVIHQILFWLNRIGLGYVLFRLTSDVERLTFPLAKVASEGAMALAETSGKREGWRWRIFSIATMIGVVYGAFYVLVPVFTGLFMTKPLMLIPIPFVDFTKEIGGFLPAAMLGFMTDLSPLLAGFILPFWVVIGMFIGSFGSRVILNPVLHHQGIIQNWRPGMTVLPTGLTTDLDFWLSIVIGTGIVVGIIGTCTVIVALWKKRTTTGKREIPPGRGDMPIWLALGIWLVSTIGYVVLCHILVPKFPILIFCFFGFVMTPFLSYISARMYGITGSVTGIQFPMVKEGSFILSRYRGCDIWFAPVPYFNHGATAQEFKQLELTRTRFTCWYKATAASFAIMAFCSFLFWTLIWRMAPIPSSVYPFVQRMWPIFAQRKALWASALLPAEGARSWMLEAIRLKVILIGAGGAGLLFLLVSVLHLPAGLFYGIIGGVYTVPHYTLPLLTGALLGRYFFSRRIGEKTWRSYAPILLAGYACGIGLVGAVGTALALIVKTVSKLVF